ncbi:hypothetical protein FHG87_017829, partial [Trinorchestia longiramus]
MVVTSRMLAAHTYGYPLDVKSRFWSNYYRSLKGLSPLESYADGRCSYRRVPTPRIRDVSHPWWYDIPSLRPGDLPKDFLPAQCKYDVALRPSFLSPVKKHYVWYGHPKRPRC